MMTDAADFIYVLLSQAQLDVAHDSGTYVPSDFESEGFVHASPREQLSRVANKFYREVSELRLLEIDPRRVKAEVRWEPAAGGLYPHIYGPLNLSAVVRIVAVPRDAEGKWLPEQALSEIDNK